MLVHEPGREPVPLAEWLPDHARHHWGKVHGFDRADPELQGDQL